jgi:hypothetical protein
MRDFKLGASPLTDAVPSTAATVGGPETVRPSNGRSLATVLQGLRPPLRRDAGGKTSREPTQVSGCMSLRECVLVVIEASLVSLTCEQVLEELRAKGRRATLSGVRARRSELGRGVGLIADSGLRGRAEGGKRAIRWRATNVEERAAWAALRSERASS